MGCDDRSKGNAEEGERESKGGNGHGDMEMHHDALNADGQRGHTESSAECSALFSVLLRAEGIVNGAHKEDRLTLRKQKMLQPWKRIFSARMASSVGFRDHAGPSGGGPLMETSQMAP